MHSRIVHTSTTAFFLGVIFFISCGTARAAAIAWNTFLGGTGNDYSSSMAADGAGNIYVSGSSDSAWGTPVLSYSGTGTDAFVAKLDASGALVWSTYLGSNAGGDSARQIVFDASGNLVVCGTSGATWGTAPLQPYVLGRDGFIVKINSATGAVIWHTFFGGNGDDWAFGSSCDSSGNIYVAGQSDQTWGTSPVNAHQGGNDAFAAKFSADGALLWHTFLGSADVDEGSAVAADASGNCYISGTSKAAWGSTTVRAHAGDGLQDGFVAKLDSGGALVWNTFLGGADIDSVNTLFRDGSGELFAAGISTTAWGAPLRAFSFQDAYVAKLDANGNLLWNTFMGGGTGFELSRSLVSDASGAVYLGGISEAAWGTPLNPYTTSGADCMLVKLDSAGNLLWNTFYGGAGNDYINGMQLDAHGNMLCAGLSGASWGSPILAFASGVHDAGIFKVALPPVTQATGISATAQPNQADITWTRGSGEKCAVFIKQADSATASPADASTYTADTAFNSGTQIGMTGWYCIYNGTGTAVTVTGLTPATAYSVMACEYNGAAGIEQYAIGTATANPAAFMTLDNGTTCELRVIPKNVHRVLGIVEPIKFYVLVGDSDTTFTAADKPVWNSGAMRGLFKLKLGQRAMLSVVFVNTLALTGSDVEVTVGACRGVLGVKPF